MKKEKDIIENFREKIKLNILKVPQEQISNSMSIVRGQFKAVWKANDYRRQMLVKSRTDRSLLLIQRSIPEKYFSIGKRNKLIFVRNYYGCIIQYGTEKLTAYYTQEIIDGKKLAHIISSDIFENIVDWINNKRVEIQKLLDFALFSFVKQFKLKLPFEKPIWIRHEDWTSKDNFIIDKFANDAIFHEVLTKNTFIKKVYSEGVEFAGGKEAEPTDNMINHLRNSALNNFSPAIAEELSGLRSLFSDFANSQSDYAKNIQQHIKVMKSLDKGVNKFSNAVSDFTMQSNQLDFLKSKIRSFDDLMVNKHLIKKLKEFEREDLGMWLFNKFGGRN